MVGFIEEAVFELTWKELGENILGIRNRTKAE